MNILYASQVRTSICLSMDEAVSSSCSSAVQLGGRAIDRHNPIIRDAKRFNTNPSPYNQLRKNGNGSSGKSKSKDHKKKSWTKKSSLKLPTDTEDSNGSKGIDFVTPPGSSRYLLGNSGFLDEISDYDPAWVLVPFQEDQIKVVKRDQSVVVVLRVSLHCKGCEGKVRKHISRMEGVRSYSIDFAAKKVTIVGNVTPLGVLASVSKVKSAQFWTPATPALASTSLSANK
ncbi:hypothetical protein V6Z11_D13G114400 [Gossypium hirsutum]